MTTLTLAMLVYNTGARLHALIAHARMYADDIVLGVDDASDPLTKDLASRLADRVVPCPHIPLIDANRRLLLPACRGRWVLFLDDDERFGGDYQALWTTLQSSGDICGYSLSTQWVASLDPLAYFCEAPWWPDWHLRLLRNDPGALRHSGQLHAHWEVDGPVAPLASGSIWHYERVIRTTAEREEKFARYRTHGGFAPVIEQYYRASGLTAPLPPEAHPEYPILAESILYGW